MLRTDNALNIVRLVLVLGVVFSHSFTVGRYGTSPDWLGYTPGEWSLACLFTVSGYLITSGATNNAYGRFLGRRLARLWPAYLACIIAVAVLFAPIAYFIEHETLDGFFGGEHGPIGFITHNALLELRQPLISGTPDKFGWSGNLWTVFFTILSYSIIGLALQARDTRLRLILVVTVFVAATAVFTSYDLVAPYVQDGRVQQLARLLPFFAAGTLLFLIRDRVRVRWWMIPSAALIAVLIVAAIPEWGLQLATPLLGLALLGIANLGTLPRWFASNDVSLGFFMYSFPVQKIIRLTGASEALGDPWIYFLVSVIATAPFAVASWYLIERPIIRATRRRERRDSMPPPRAVAPVA